MNQILFNAVGLRRLFWFLKSCLSHDDTLYKAHDIFHAKIVSSVQNHDRFKSFKCSIESIDSKVWISVIRDDGSSKGTTWRKSWATWTRSSTTRPRVIRRHQECAKIIFIFPNMIKSNVRGKSKSVLPSVLPPSFPLGLVKIDSKLVPPPHFRPNLRGYGSDKNYDNLRLKVPYYRGSSCSAYFSAVQFLK